MVDEKPVLTVDEAADMFSISARHVKRLVKLGAFPQPIRLGKSIRWLRSDIEKWVREGCRPLEHANG